jgi:hypothetical protein
MQLLDSPPCDDTSPPCGDPASDSIDEANAAVAWPLTNGGFTLISPCDVDVVSRHNWRSVVIAKHTYACTRLNKSRLYLHRLLCGYGYWDDKTGKWVSNSVDHRDGDGLRNTRANLRSCSHRENMRNSVGKPMSRRSRFKGVNFSMRARRRPWRAVITVDGRQVSGGYFECEEAAARRYNEMATIYFGEFARLNHVEDRGGADLSAPRNLGGLEYPRV